jgi:hypothetical protein
MAATMPRVPGQVTFSKKDLVAGTAGDAEFGDMRYIPGVGTLTGVYPLTPL